MYSKLNLFGNGFCGSFGCCCGCHQWCGFLRSLSQRLPNLSSGSVEEHGNVCLPELLEDLEVDRRVGRLKNTDSAVQILLDVVLPLAHFIVQFSETVVVSRTAKERGLMERLEVSGVRVEIIT